MKERGEESTTDNKEWLDHWNSSFLEYHSFYHSTIPCIAIAITMALPSRDIPKLSTIILKDIARQPVKFLSAKDINYNSPVYAKIAGNFDIAQVLIDYITEAGRLADDVMPVNLFQKERTHLTLKNSKLSPKYISKIIEQCTQLQV